MKLNDHFMLREVAGCHVVPVGETVINFSGMFSVSETGAFLWKLLEVGDTLEGLVQALQSAYEVDGKTAKKDVAEFIQKLTEIGALN